MPRVRLLVSPTGRRHYVDMGLEMIEMQGARPTRCGRSSTTRRENSSRGREGRSCAKGGRASAAGSRVSARGSDRLTYPRRPAARTRECGVQKRGGELVYSPSDIIVFLESPFASWM